MRPQGHQNWLGHEDTKAFWQIKTDQKQMLLLNDCSMIGAGICMFIFHKPEVQTVILIYSTGLNLNWFKSYGLKGSLRPHTTLANSQKIATDK